MCGNEDTYCEFHSKKTTMHIPSQDGEVDETILEVGKQVYLAKQNGKSEESVQIKTEHKKLGLQLVLQYCMDQYMVANNLVATDDE